MKAFFSDELKKELLAIDAGITFVDVSEAIKGMVSERPKKHTSETAVI